MSNDAPQEEAEGTPEAEPKPVKLWSVRSPVFTESGEAPTFLSRTGSRVGPEERVLRFPSRHSMGVLYGTYWGRRLPDVFDGGWWKIGSARGKVVIPAGNQVWLAVGDRAATDLSPLAGLEPDALQTISFDSTSVSDEQVIHLRGLTGLRDLGLGVTNITDEGLAHISCLSKLRRLDLRETRISDDGLRHLSGLKELRVLRLAHQYLGQAAGPYAA